MTVCDGCLTAVYDENPRLFTEMEVSDARRLQEDTAMSIGKELPDHVCEDPGNCECTCRPRLTRPIHEDSGVLIGP